MAIFTAATALAGVAGTLFAGAGTALAGAGGLTTLTQIAGLGLKAYSAFDSFEAASETEGLFDDQAAALNTRFEADLRASELNNKIEKIRDRVTRLDFFRRQREVIRNSQRQIAEGRSAAANQGALFSSGKEGGAAQVLGNSSFEFNILRRNQNANNQIIGLREDILEQNRISAEAETRFNFLSMLEKQTQVQQQEAQAFGDFGTTLLNNAETIGSLFAST